MNAHSLVARARPASRGSSSGIAILPTSCSSAARRTSLTSSAGRPEALGDRAGERRRPGAVWPSRSGERSAQHAQQDVGALALGRRRAPPRLCAYMRWSAVAQRVLGASRASSGSSTTPYEQPTLKPLAGSRAARARRAAAEALRVVAAALEQRAELVAAHPVGACRGRRRPSAARAPRRIEQRVAGRVAEGVVVVLEAVEVEEHEDHRAARRARRGSTRLEVVGQPAAVAQPGERVGQRVLAGGARAGRCSGGRRRTRRAEHREQRQRRRAARPAGCSRPTSPRR